MKAIMIMYDQSHSELILEILDKTNVRGFTKWVDVQGRGTHRGDPHYGSHAWPAKNMATLAMVEEAQLPSLLQALKELNARSEKQGLRAFVWEAESAV